MKDFGFLITAYQNVLLTEQNVKRIRVQYKELGQSPIVIVTTSAIDVGFAEISDLYNNVHVIEFLDAPGNASCDWFKSPPCDPDRPHEPYFNWGQQWLPPRIMYSMQKGVNYLYDRGVKCALHLHQDTYWRTSHEENLVTEALELEKRQLLMIADISIDEENSIRGRDIIPPGIHLHPEGIMLNLEMCKKTGYVFNFDKVFDLGGGFRSHCYGSNEALFGQFAIWSLTGQNVFKWEHVIPQEYFDKVRVRSTRTYHGVFGSGLVNVRVPSAF